MTSVRKVEERCLRTLETVRFRDCNERSTHCRLWPLRLASQNRTLLRKRNIAVSIVSGNDTGAIEAVATKLNILANPVRSRCTPGDKQNYLNSIMMDEKRIVIFCGDGTNDAVALAQAGRGEEEMWHRGPAFC
jgi:soluble P-type ATPase